MHGTRESFSIWHFDCSFHVWRFTLPMRKLVLVICLLSIAAPLADAQNGPNGQNGQNGQKPKAHAPEMSGITMSVAGIIGLGGYLLIRRRLSPQN